jgi:5'(3')-deoxyribonucleotidase
MVTREPEYVVGLDLDGVVADFYSRMREIAADWQGVPVHSLTEEVSYGLPEWGLVDGEYKRLHRYAVTQRRLFASMPAIEGAPQAIRRLSAEKVRLRIITHRLYLEYSHEVSVAQTVQWLEAHGIPYWDLCLMRDKELVDANVYVEDSPENIERLQDCGKDVIILSNSTNRGQPGKRANTWREAESMIRRCYYSWLDSQARPRPRGVGLPPRPDTCCCRDPHHHH